MDVCSLQIFSSTCSLLSLFVEARLFMLLYSLAAAGFKIFEFWMIHVQQPFRYCYPLAIGPWQSPLCQSDLQTIYNVLNIESSLSYCLAIWTGTVSRMSLQFECIMLLSTICWTLIESTRALYKGQVTQREYLIECCLVGVYVLTNVMHVCYYKRMFC